MTFEFDLVARAGGCFWRSFSLAGLFELFALFVIVCLGVRHEDAQFLCPQSSVPAVFIAVAVINFNQEIRRCAPQFQPGKHSFPMRLTTEMP